jgi:hypothetical protein
MFDKVIAWKVSIMDGFFHGVVIDWLNVGAAAATILVPIATVLTVIWNRIRKKRKIAKDNEVRIFVGYKNGLPVPDETHIVGFFGKKPLNKGETWIHRKWIGTNITIHDTITGRLLGTAELKLKGNDSTITILLSGKKD